MSVKVVNPGLFTTIQDLGRPGYFHLGIPMSGRIDRYALSAATLLVGNDAAPAVTQSPCMRPTP